MLKLLLLLITISLFQSWNKNPEIGKVISIVEGKQVYCLGSFISYRHLITASVCVGRQIQIQAYPMRSIYMVVISSNYPEL